MYCVQLTVVEWQLCLGTDLLWWSRELEGPWHWGWQGHLQQLQAFSSPISCNETQTQAEAPP